MAVTEPEPAYFNLQLKPEIGLILEDFIFTARLGLVDDAITIIREVLWQHILFFPVFAEVVTFLVIEDKIRDLCSIIELIRDEPEAEDANVWQTRFVSEFRFWFLVASADRSDTVGRLHEFNSTKRLLACEMFRLLATGLECPGPIQIQSRLIAFRLAASLPQEFDQWETGGFDALADTTYRWFQEQGCLWEAILTLRIYSNTINRIGTTTYSWKLTPAMMHSLETRKAYGDIEMISPADIGPILNPLLCLLLADLIAVQFSSFHDATLKSSDTLILVKEATHVFLMLMQEMPDRTPRGLHWDMLTKFHRMLDLRSNHGGQRDVWETVLNSELGIQTRSRNADAIKKYVVVVGALTSDIVMGRRSTSKDGDTNKILKYEELSGLGANTAICIYRASHNSPLSDISANDSGKQRYDIDIQMIASAATENSSRELCDRLRANGVDSNGVRILPPSSDDHMERSKINELYAKYGEETLTSNSQLEDHPSLTQRPIFRSGPSRRWSPSHFNTIQKISPTVRPALLVVTNELPSDVIRQILGTAAGQYIDDLYIAMSGELFLPDDRDDKGITHLICCATDCANILSDFGRHDEAVWTWRRVCLGLMQRGVHNVVLKIGPHAAYYMNRTCSGFVGRELKSSDSHDTFSSISSFAGAYAVHYVENRDNWDLQTAVERAVRATSLHVIQIGRRTIVPWKNEIDEAREVPLYYTPTDIDELYVPGPFATQKRNDLLRSSKVGPNVVSPSKDVRLPATGNVHWTLT